jgi:hypothetical protein
LATKAEIESSSPVEEHGSRDGRWRLKQKSSLAKSTRLDAQRSNAKGQQRPRAPVALGDVMLVNPLEEARYDPINSVGSDQMTELKKLRKIAAKAEKKAGKKTKSKSKKSGFKSV